MRTMVLRLGAGLLFGMALVPAAFAQAPQGTSFTYQGRLTESGALASGPYDFQFVLYDAPVGGTQVGPTVTFDDVTVSVGLFTISLDFGSVFGSEKRWLELGVRPGADPGPYTPILPRQELTPGPSSIFSAAAGDSLQLGGVPASQFVQTDDPRLTDARNPLPGSPDYVQNSTVAQPGVSFNVGGTGAASIFDAGAQFNIGGTRILSNPGTHNLFAGANAGASNTTGEANAFFGTEAGSANTTGGSNSFFGYNAGHATTTSHNNSFFGDAAGFFNTTGAGGSFFGFLAGGNNTTGNGNAFFGQAAGLSNTTGGGNAFFGDQAGLSNTTSNNNAFFGSRAGRANLTGFGNAFVGASAGAANTTGNLNSFFGNLAGSTNTDGSSNAFFGASAGQQNSSGGGNAYLGPSAGFSGTTGMRNTFVGSFAGLNNTTGSDNTFVGYGAVLESLDTASNGNTLLGANATVVANLSNATAVGATARVTQSNSLVLGSILGVNGATASTNVGIGTSAPSARLHIVDGGPPMLFGASAGCAGFVGLSFLSIGSNCQGFALFGGDGSTHLNRPGGGSIFFQESNVTQVIIRPGGTLALGALGSAGTTALCRNASGDVSTCSSSLRYKTDVAPFRGGLDLVERLRPIRFTWKASGQQDIGLAAEEVAEVDPLLAFKNADGEIEGVNYSQLTVVLVNALKQQEERLERQEREIEALRALVCRLGQQAAPCPD